jgi:6-phosphogluconolactonase (cycloisomerase 2 family)
VTVDPSGQFTYVANTNANTLSGFSIDPSSGALTLIGEPVFTGVGNPISIATTGRIQ